MSKTRVVVTGLGVVAPNAVGVANFKEAIKEGRSGIEFYQKLEDLNFRCQIGGKPPVTEEIKKEIFTELELKRFTATGVIYGIIAGMEAWNDSGLPVVDKTNSEPQWDFGTIFGTGMCGVDTFREAFYKVDDKNVRRLGTTVVEQTMPSGISAFLGGRIGLGNQVTSNASACSTGTESLVMAYERIRNGQAKAILAGGCDADGPYVWGGFDTMRVLAYKYNDQPEKASRPMSATAAGFVPGSGGGALVLEDFDHAIARGAHIYGEIIGGYLNSGGQRGTGSMTAPNAIGTQKCIQGALADAGIEPDEIDLVCGHLTSTMGDVLEIKNISTALGRKGKDFPMVNALKSMTGHCLSAAGAIESVASILQLEGGFVHPSINCEEVHPDILQNINDNCIVREYREQELNIVLKPSFGFGDVNSCLLLKKYNS